MPTDISVRVRSWPAIRADVGYASGNPLCLQIAEGDSGEVVAEILIFTKSHELTCDLAAAINAAVAAEKGA